MLQHHFCFIDPYVCLPILHYLDSCSLIVGLKIGQLKPSSIAILIQNPPAILDPLKPYMRFRISSQFQPKHRHTGGGHLNITESSGPHARISSFTYLFFNFVQKCIVNFSIRVFAYFVEFIPGYSKFFLSYYKLVTSI